MRCWIILCWLTCLLGYSNSVFASQWHYGWINSNEKVFTLRKGYSFPGKIGGTCQLEVAKNEAEAIQIVIFNKEKIKNVKFKVSNFVSKTNDIISSNQIYIAPVGFVNTQNYQREKRTDWDEGWYITESHYQGLYPDVLLSHLNKFDLPANMNQPLWLEVKTTPKQAPGKYIGNVTITADKMPKMNIPVEIVVWDFSLPPQRSFPVTLTWRDRELLLYKKFYGYSKKDWTEFRKYISREIDAKDLTNGGKELYNIRQKAHELLIEHGFFPDKLYRWNAVRVEEIKKMINAGMPCYNIVTIYNKPSTDTTEHYPKFQTDHILKELDLIVPKLKEAGILDKGYIYAFDEIKKEHEFKAAKEILSTIKKKYPHIPIMTTSIDLTFGEKSGLRDYIDIWCPQTNFYDKSTNAIKKARAAGEKVWWYLCCYPFTPYANWFIDYTSAEHRLSMGFMPFKYKPEGYLYYQVNRWIEYKNLETPEGNKKVIPIIYPPVLDGPITNAAPYTWNMAACDGMILYPGPLGALPSIRLKNIRDGAEDYEYLCLLNSIVEKVKKSKNAKNNLSWINDAEETLKINPDILKNMKEFTRKGIKIVLERQKIATLIQTGNKILQQK